MAAAALAAGAIWHASGLAGTAILDAPAELRARSGSAVATGRSLPLARAAGLAEEALVSTRLQPELSVAPHHNDFRDVTQGSAVVGYSTPTYVSMDQPRSVSLLFSTGQLTPTGFVQVDAIDRSYEVPTRMSIRLRRSGTQEWVTFSNGSTELFYSARGGTTRLAAQFDASAYATGFYNFDVVVRSWWESNYSLETVALARVLIVNEAASPFGKGWSMVGLQRLYTDVLGGHAVLTEGDGTAKLFLVADGNGNYNTPQGDFTQLYFTSRAGNNGDPAYYRREYPDGSVAFFFGEPLQVNYGRLNYVVDRFGNIVSFGYDALGRLERVTDPVGKVTTFSYTSDGVLAWIQDPMGRRVTTTTSGGYLSGFRDPDGSLALDLSFDATAGRLLERWDRGGSRSVAGSEWSYAYDAFGQLSSVTAPQVTTTDAGLTRPVTRFTSLQAAVLPAGATSYTAPAPRILPANVRVQVTGPRGDTTRVALDRYGAPTRIEAPHGRVSTITRNQHSQVVRTVAHSGHAVTNYWSGPRLTQVWDETTDARVYYEYEHPNHFLTRVHGSTEEVRYAYYGAVSSRPDSMDVITTADTTRYRFLADGALGAITDPGGHGTTFGYSATDRNTVLERTGVYTHRDVTYLHDTYGRVIRATNPDGQRDSVVYDVTNRTVKTWNAANDTTAYEYSARGLWKVRDAKGQVYQFNRNALGWVESEVDPRGLSTVYRYDRNGNVTERVNRRNQTVRSTYDKLGRVLTVTDVATGAVTSYSYASNDRWMRVSNAESTDTLHYDAAGRAIGHVALRGGTRYALSSTYDARGVRTGLAMSAPWVRSAGYHYGARMRLDSIRDLSGAVTRLWYNDEGLLEWTQLPGLAPSFGQEYPSTHVNARTRFSSPAINDTLGVAYTQDKQGRVSSRYSADLLNVRRFYYDVVGRLERYEDEVGDDFNCEYVPYFDADQGVLATAQPRDELSECSTVDYAPVGGDLYTYDRVGNPSGSGVVVGTGNRLTTAGPWTLQYDNDGNLTSKSGNGITQTFAWNAAGQLVSLTSNGQTTTYGYDGIGRRVRKTTASGTVRYLYDGDNLFMELDGAGNVLREYTYYPGAVDRPLSVRTGGQTYYYVTEQPNHVTALLDGQGRIANQYRYSPWGMPESTRETVANPLRFTAREYDSESGLYFHRARYYDPQFGRFISEDPIGLSGGINPYVYAGNDPVNSADPWGLQECQLMAKISITWYDDGSATIDVLGYYWDCSAADAFGEGGGGKGGRCTVHPDCKLRKRTSGELRYIRDRIREFRTAGFCGLIGKSATAMVNRATYMWDDELRQSGPDGKEGVLAGQALWISNRANTHGFLGVAFYSGDMTPGREKSARNTIGHEGLHGVLFRTGHNPRGYGHGDITPLKLDFWSTVAYCTNSNVE